MYATVKTTTTIVETAQNRCQRFKLRRKTENCSNKRLRYLVIGVFPLITFFAIVALTIVADGNSVASVFF